MLESVYQKILIDKLKLLFPGCIILKNDSGYIQGIPDLTVLYKDRWAFLEVKESSTAKQQMNQQYYVELANKLSFGAFIYPENEEEVLDVLQRSFRSRRTARVAKP